jgi:hypothetical protein
VLFAGVPGRGKSTLVAAAGAGGTQAFAEDAVALTVGHEGATAWAGPRGVRVGAATAAAFGLGAAPGPLKETFLSPAADADAAQAPVAAVVLLGERGAPEPTLVRVAPVEAVPALVPSLMFAGSDGLAQAFRGASALAARVPIYRCSFPDDLDALPAHVLAVLDELTLSGAAAPRF